VEQVGHEMMICGDWEPSVTMSSLPLKESIYATLGSMIPVQIRKTQDPQGNDKADSVAHPCFSLVRLVTLPLPNRMPISGRAIQANFLEARGSTSSPLPSDA
jgi:hypothetical protein